MYQPISFIHPFIANEEKILMASFKTYAFVMFNKIGYLGFVDWLLFKLIYGIRLLKHEA